MRLLGTKHPDVANSKSYLAFLLAEEGRFSEANKLVKDVLKTFERELDDPKFAPVLSSLSVIYKTARQVVFPAAVTGRQRLTKLIELNCGTDSLPLI
jgi:hypothetical protein